MKFPQLTKIVIWLNIRSLLSELLKLILLNFLRDRKGGWQNYLTQAPFICLFWNFWQCHTLLISRMCLLSPHPSVDVKRFSAEVSKLHVVMRPVWRHWKLQSRRVTEPWVQIVSSNSVSVASSSTEPLTHNLIKLKPLISSQPRPLVHIRRVHVHT